MGEAEGEGAPPMSQTSTFQSGGSVSVFTMKPVVGATGAEAVRSAARCKTEVLPAPSKPRQRTLASYHTTERARHNCAHHAAADVWFGGGTHSAWA